VDNFYIKTWKHLKVLEDLNYHEHKGYIEQSRVNREAVPINAENQRMGNFTLGIQDFFTDPKDLKSTAVKSTVTSET
jgi:hypothetical protein